MWSGNGRPLTKTPPSWLTPVCPRWSLINEYLYRRSTHLCQVHTTCFSFFFQMISFNSTDQWSERREREWLNEERKVINAHFLTLLKMIWIPILIFNHFQNVKIDYSLRTQMCDQLRFASSIVSLPQQWTSLLQISSQFDDYSFFRRSIMNCHW